MYLCFLKKKYNVAFHGLWFTWHFDTDILAECGPIQHEDDDPMDGLEFPSPLCYCNLGTTADT